MTTPVIILVLLTAPLPVGLALIVMLVLSLPVNIYAAVNRIGPGGHQWRPVHLLIRIPLQAILIGWVWWFAVRPSLIHRHPESASSL